MLVEQLEKSKAEGKIRRNYIKPQLDSKPKKQLLPKEEVKRAKGFAKLTYVLSSL